MKIVILDTNIISFILKGDSRTELYASHLQGCRPALSFMTVAELFQWASVRNWGARRIPKLRKLETFLGAVRKRWQPQIQRCDGIGSTR
jgi:tRNA(fMet)-specific endonuclease VapC